MANKTKILSDLSKIAVDAMSTFSGIKKELETLVKLRVNSAINKMNLVKRDEFEILKKRVQKLTIEYENYKNHSSSKRKRKNIKKIKKTNKSG